MGKILFKDVAKIQTGQLHIFGGRKNADLGRGCYKTSDLLFRKYSRHCGSLFFADEAVINVKPGLG